MNRRALRELYHSTPVPEEELSRRVEEAIRRQRPRPRMRGWQKSLTGLAACFALFVVSVNLSPAFAASLQDVPLVGDVAQLVTFDHFHQVDAATWWKSPPSAVRGTPPWNSRSTAASPTKWRLCSKRPPRWRKNT